ncbi:enoyl-CoA hydratase-related protein, partial [Kocuria sp.]
PETSLGIMPAAGGTQRLARLVGVGRATEMILTSRRVKAQEALSMGLVTDVVEPEDLMPTAKDTARTILAKGPLATQLAKTVVRHGFDADHGTGILLERLAQAVLYSSAEKVEGTTAFLEKRTPDYRAAQRKDDDA